MSLAKELQRPVNLLMNHSHKVKSRDMSAVLTAESAAAGLRYLERYGYLKRSLLDSIKDISLADILSAIKTFASWFGLALPRGAGLTPQMLRLMAQPRCGCPDIPRSYHTDYLRTRDFAKASLAAWRKRSLLYAQTAYVAGLSKPQQDALIDQAFASWTQHGQIDARRAMPGETPDIVLGTGQGGASNFDGAGGVLAWAYMPTGNDQQLQLRFDLAETWTSEQTQRGILLLNVAAHELGHSFGLDHSRVQAALMAPYYNAAIPSPQANDDIPRFTARYGVRTSPTTPTPPPPGTSRITIEVSGQVRDARIVSIT
jgi:hypothetical protein